MARVLITPSVLKSPTVQGHCFNACAMREQRRHALRVASEGAEAGLYRLSEDGAHVVIAVSKWPELQELAPAPPQQHPSSTPATKTKTKTTPKTKTNSPPSEGAEAASPGTDQEPPEPDDSRPPPGYESGQWLAAQLTLTARAAPEERSIWLEAKWAEILAAALIEAEGAPIRNHAIRIASARWNAYLAERDPARRQFAREARSRATVPARLAFDASAETNPRASPAAESLDADPLALLRAGVNPNAN